MGVLRVGLADDSFLVREALASLLRGAPDVVEVAEVCSDAEGLRTAVEEQRLDVVVTDIRLPPTFTDEGIRLAAHLRRAHPEVGVVVMSAHCEAAYALALLESGSDGRAYILKDHVHSRRQLLATIETVAGNGSVIDPKVVEELVRGRAHHGGSRLERLTALERRTLGEMAQGASNPAIARRLELTKRAVEKHVNAVFAKLELPPTPDVSRRVQAVLLFLADADARSRRATPRT